MKSFAAGVYTKMELWYFTLISVILMCLSLSLLAVVSYLGLSVASTLTTIGGKRQLKK
jgi:hypothetical protein